VTASNLNCDDKFLSDLKSSMKMNGEPPSGSNMEVGIEITRQAKMKLTLVYTHGRNFMY
jgi:hypothetical protein